jgi:hypothetical protein
MTKLVLFGHSLFFLGVSLPLLLPTLGSGYTLQVLAGFRFRSTQLWAFRCYPSRKINSTSQFQITVPEIRVQITF